MTALVVPLATTTKMEVIRRNKVTTLTVGVILVSIAMIDGNNLEIAAYDILRF